MKTCVLDASVVVAAMLDENECARKIFKTKVEFHAPVLLSYEVANALKSKVPIKDQSDRLFIKFVALPIKYHEFTQEQIQAILGMTYETDSTIYDTCYHFLAKSLDTVLLTYDQKYYQKAKKLGSIELIK